MPEASLPGPGNQHRLPSWLVTECYCLARVWLPAAIMQRQRSIIGALPHPRSRSPLMILQTDHELGSPKADGMRVLIVEDNPDVAEMMALLVQHCGHEAQVVADGAEALQAADRWKPEVVLLDVGLPGMDGYEVAPKLRAAGLPTAKLYLLSGHGPDAARAGESTLDGHVMKPITLQKLRQILSC